MQLTHRGDGELAEYVSEHYQCELPGYECVLGPAHTASHHDPPHCVLVRFLSCFPYFSGRFNTQN